MKLLEENIRAVLEEIDLCKYLGRPQNHKGEYVKLRRFCNAKETVSRDNP